jgi:AAA domain
MTTPSLDAQAEAEIAAAFAANGIDNTAIERRERLRVVPDREEPPPHEFIPDSADGDHDLEAEAADAAKESPESKSAPRWQDTLAQDRDIKTVDFRTLLEENVVEEPDYIEPNFAGPGQFILIAGPPKAQKSLLLQEMLVSCALGVPFLLNTFKVTRPLRVFYLQAEMNRKLLRKRAREFQDLTAAERELVGRNLVVSERFRMLLSDDGVKKVIEIIKRDFPDAPPDVIGIDPLANMFDGDNENDNSQLLKFIMTRLEAIRAAINSNAVIVLVHHSAKRSADDMARDPFATIRGAGALRGYYDSCIIIFRVSEESKTRKIHFELRSGDAPEPMTVVFSKGRFRDASTIATIDKPMARKMLGDLKAAWDEAKPWALSPQAKSEGRGACYNLARAYNVKPGEVTTLINEWARLNVITFRDRKRKHPAGFEVTGTLD